MITPTDLINVKLKATSFWSKGYDFDEVDDYIDSVISFLNKNPKDVTKDEFQQLTSPRFRQVSFSQGYDFDQTDKLLLEIKNTIRQHMNDSAN